MRILLWLLLALNGVVAAWLSGFRLPAPARPEPAPPALAAKRLELLSELPSLPPRLDAQSDLASVPSEAETPAGAAVDAAPAADAGLSARPAPEDPAPAPTDRAGDTPAPPGDASPEPAASAAPAAAQAPEAASSSAKSPDAPPAGSPADSAATLPPAISTVAAESVGAAPAPDAPVCHRTAALAPAAKDTVGAALREAGLGEPVLSASQRPRYWVYWSGAPGDAAAVEEALKAGGVKDWYRAGGAGQATISLGVYGQVEGARRRQRELATKSVQATVEPRYGPQARLRWEITAPPSAVAAVADQLARAAVRLEPCR